MAGVAVFAASGVLAARDRDLDLPGVLMVATLTAIGGGTLRDLLLDRHPIFWIVDTWYLIVIIAATLATIIYLRLRPPPGKILLIADALGLALFAMLGAKLTLMANHSPLIVVLMGTMTGVTGGVLRDVVTARIPLILSVRMSSHLQTHQPRKMGLTRQEGGLNERISLNCARVCRRFHLQATFVQ